MNAPNLPDAGALLAGLLAGIGDGPSDNPAPAVHRCAGDCEAQVPTRGDYCAPCGVRLATELRTSMLAAAYESLPGGWDWARFGSQAYAVVAAKRLPGGPVRPLHDAAHAWRRQTGTMTLLGPSGAGKTAAAVAIAHRILDCARDRPLPAADLRFAAGLRFVPAIDIATARREHRLGQGDPPLLTMASKASLLILDELGYLETKHDLSAVQEVVDARYRGSLPTIYTSGQTWAGLAKVYGDATARRVCELGQLVELGEERRAG